MVEGPVDVRMQDTLRQTSCRQSTPHRPSPPQHQAPAHQDDTCVALQGSEPLARPKGFRKLNAKATVMLLAPLDGAKLHRRGRRDGLQGT